MSTSLLMAGLLALAASSSAKAAASRSCEEVVRKAVLATARVMGVREEIGFEVHPTGEHPTTRFGERLDEYSTSVFFIDEGYLSDSGATVAVKPTRDSCDIVRLRVHTR